MIIGYEAKRIFHNRSGLGNFGRNLIRALAQYYPDNQYLLLNSHPGKVSFGHELSPVKEIRPVLSGPLYRDIWRQYLMSNHVRKLKPDLFHGLSMELPKGITKTGVPSVLSVHDLIFLRYPELYKKIDRSIYTAKLRRSVNEATLIVATSEQTKKDLVEYLDLPESDIKVIYQGVQPLYWQKADQKEIEETILQYRLPERYALFVGTLEERKGVHRLLEAQLQTGIDLVYIGRPTRFWERELASARFDSIREKIHTPVVADNTDLSRIYQGARFFIYPSIFEGFGIPVLEALVSGTPVITANTSSLPEVAGPASLLIDPEDVSAIAEAMQTLWQSEEQRMASVKNSSTFIEQFRDEQIAAQWINTYASLLS